jgi:hypothetical protein
VVADIGVSPYVPHAASPQLVLPHYTVIGAGRVREVGVDLRGQPVAETASELARGVGQLGVATIACSHSLGRKWGSEAG